MPVDTVGQPDNIAWLARLPLSGARARRLGQRTRRGIRRHVLVRNAITRPYLLLCCFAGLAVGLVEPARWLLSARFLVAWDVAVALYLILKTRAVATPSRATARRDALLHDEAQFAILAMCIMAAAASFVASVSVLGSLKGDAADHSVLLGLAGLTILVSWTFIHFVFAQHYAHEYVMGQWGRTERTSEVGGLLFPNTPTPTFSDFLYYAFTIGCASQTADVAVVSTSMRGLTLVHSIVAFVFNTSVLALTINIASGLL
jgi:uncharacterized membrane protein